MVLRFCTCPFLRGNRESNSSLFFSVACNATVALNECNWVQAFAIILVMKKINASKAVSFPLFISTELSK